MEKEPAGPKGFDARKFEEFLKKAPPAYGGVTNEERIGAAANLRGSYSKEEIAFVQRKLYEAIEGGAGKLTDEMIEDAFHFVDPMDPNNE